jgi:tetratricopeptide (TPR) repeat protein
MSSPPLAEFQRHFGERLNQRDWPGATAVASACRAAWPSESTGWLLGSIVALLADRKEEARALMEEYLASHPGDVQCLLQRAECLLALGRRADAVAAAKDAAAGAGDTPAVLDAIGEFLVSANEHREALVIYHQAVAAAPRNPDLRGKRATVHRYLGNFERAADDFEAVLGMAPGDAEALKELVELREQTRERNWIAPLQARLASSPGDSPEAVTLHFALAKAYEDLGEYALSWRHLSSANALERRRVQYDPGEDRAVIERLMQVFPSLEAARPDTSGEKPIFIVGLPRSGTTLVDRILGSHSAVHCAGELPILSETLFGLSERGAQSKPGEWLEYLVELGRHDPAAIARQYLARAHAQRGERPRFTDKQTVNFFYCPLIFRAFPGARVVHLTRHPLAACYAIYKTRFRGPFPFAYQLSEIGDFYVGYRRLMAHWHEILPGRILDLPYEEVVNNQQAATRRLLAYLDLPFEAACLDFHLNPSAITTASSVQARQPLYDTSVDQWQHFASQLEPLRVQLESAGVPFD